MSTVARKEYQETKILRTVSPVRNFRSSSQNLVEFDHNLDHLLEDLQNSVSRPGSSLGHSTTHRDSSRNVHTLDSTRSNSLNRYTSVKPSNPVTEYSSDDAYNYASPDGTKRVAGYKKESYSYSTSGSGANAPVSEKVRMQNSINQLDTLLDDLQQVKSSSFLERDSYNNIGGDPDFKKASTVSSNKRSVQRELNYGDSPRAGSRTRSLERTEREGSLTRDIQYSNEGTYGDIRQIRASSPSPSSRTSTLSKQTKVTNVHSYPVETMQTTTPDINPEILAHLDPNLHPPGNTKVTTTIKTYTYEIPGAGAYPTNLETSADSEKYVYSPNQSQSTPSKSFVYQKVENKSSENTLNYHQPPSEAGWQSKIYKETTNDTTNYPAYQKPTPPGGHTLIKETITTRNYQPNYSPDTIPPSNQTYIYNETVTTKNVNDQYPNKPPPPRQETYIIEEKRNTVNRNTNQSGPPNDRDYPRGNPPRQETYIIKEIHDKNTTNTINHPYPNGYPPNEPNKTVIYRHESHSTNNKYGPGGEVESLEPKSPPYPRKKPKEPVNIQYSYKSESTTTNNYKAGYPPGDDTQTLLPKPFPTDGSQLDGPPKRLDVLLDNIGNEPPDSPYNASFTAHEHESEQRKKIESLKQQQADLDDLQQKNQPVQKSKPVAGPPVYYPPGHELFAKKEESGGWRAEGAYARGSGKYQYEAESKSKSKSSSGAAIVPVCLPLCCGLPCTII